MSVSPCTSGYIWPNAKQRNGVEETVASLDSYVSGSEQSDVAVLIIHDAFGWKLPNSRLLADQFADSLRARVFLPDFLHGKALHSDTLTDPDRAQAFDMARWRAECNPHDCMEEIAAFVRHLHNLYRKICVIGYCWGGSPALRLGGMEETLVSSVSVAHPSSVTREEIDQLKVPVQILAPEVDHLFPPEMKDYCNSKIPALNIPFAFEWFPGVRHGFATRGDPKDPLQRRAMARARGAVIHWCRVSIM